MGASRPELEGVRHALGALLGTLQSIEPLPSGSCGTSWLVETGAGHYVAKIFRKDAPALLGPAAQFRLLRRLAAAGIGPEPAGYDAGASLLVTKFIEDARAVSSAELGAPDRLAEVAALLRRLHAVAVDVPAFAPQGYAERYLEAIGGRALLRHEDRRRFEELVALAAAPLWGRRCLCHNDLTADNLLFGAKLTLIDFDYAVQGTPILDLASLVVMNGFDAGQTSALLEAYFGSASSVPPDEFARVQRIVRLLAHFWSLASPDAAASIVAQYRIDDD